MNFQMNPTGYTRLSEVCATRFNVRPSNVVKILKANEDLPEVEAARLAKAQRAEKRRKKFTR